MNIYIGADHRGFDLKEHLKTYLQSKYTVVDCGASQKNPDDDYVDFATIVAQKVASDTSSRGIVICGSGVGVDIVSNKIKGIRCGLAFDTNQISSATSHDHLNVISIPSDYIDNNRAQELVDIFLSTPPQTQTRYTTRIEKIKQLE